MKTKFAFTLVKHATLLVLLAILNFQFAVHAQNTAFTYQGQLSDAGSPATGNYDLTFALYASPNIGNPSVAGPVTNSAVAVTNGLFTVQLNFGAAIFTGTNYWLEIAVRPNSTVSFATLSPRQPLTSVPYAIFAHSASNLLGSLPSTQLSGALPSAQISGTYAGAVAFNNGANNFVGAFNGNGSGLNSLDASQLATGTVADARLSANAALLNNAQTFSGANSFTNQGNSFSGSFFGNGLVGWVTVPGTTQQASRDAGYMLTSPFFTTVTLPTTASLTMGDIVRISGAGGGGWQAKENASQSMTGNFAAYRNGYLALLSANDYHSVAASADGVRMYATSGTTVGVYGSSNSGLTWNQVSSTGATGLAGFWFSVACSADGKIVYAEPYAGGIIQKSTNYGVNWAATAFSATGTLIACSADGSTLFYNNSYACSGNGTYVGKVSGGVITLSTNGGSSFNVAVTAPAAGVTCLGVSSDCTRLVAGVNGGRLYASSNRGATWTTLTATNQNWTGAWMSPDGSKFAATINLVGSTPGGVYGCDVSVLPNTTTTTSTGSITGSQGSAVELQYIGNNQFMPVSSAGIIWAN